MARRLDFEKDHIKRIVAERGALPAHWRRWRPYLRAPKQLKRVTVHDRVQEAEKYLDRLRQLQREYRFQDRESQTSISALISLFEAAELALLRNSAFRRFVSADQSGESLFDQFIRFEQSRGRSLESLLDD
jgi:hypothetical protein